MKTESELDSDAEVIGGENNYVEVDAPPLTIRSNFEEEKSIEKIEELLLKSSQEINAEKP